MSKFWNDVLKIKNLAACQTYHTGPANLSHYELCSRMGLHVLVVCWTFKIQSKVLKNNKRKITFNSYCIRVIVHCYHAHMRCSVRQEDQTYLRVDGLMPHGLEAEVQALLWVHKTWVIKLACFFYQWRLYMKQSRQDIIISMKYNQP